MKESDLPRRVGAVLLLVFLLVVPRVGAQGDQNRGDRATGGGAEAGGEQRCGGASEELWSLDRKVSLSLALGSDHYLVGEPAILTATLTNHTEELLIVGRPFAGSHQLTLNLEVIGPDGERLKRHGGWIDMAPEGYNVFLAPFHSLHWRFDLLDNYSMSEPGEYRFKASYRSGGKYQRMLTKEIVYPWEGLMESPWISFALNAPEGLDREAFEMLVKPARPGSKVVAIRPWDWSREGKRRVAEELPTSAYAKYACYFLGWRLEVEAGPYGERRALYLQAIHWYRKAAEEYALSAFSDLAQYRHGVCHVERGEYGLAHLSFGKLLDDYPSSTLRTPTEIWKSLMGRLVGYVLGKDTDVSILLEHLHKWETYSSQDEAIVYDLARARDSRLIPQFAYVLTEPEPSKRYRLEAIEALGLLNDPATVPHLVSALNDPWHAVRRSAAEYLARLRMRGDREVISALRQAFQTEKVGQVEEAIIAALAELCEPGEVIPILREALADEDYEARQAAARELAHEVGADGLQVLRDSLGSEDAGVAWAAAYVLGLKGEKEAAPVIAKHLKAQSLHVQTNAIPILGKLGDARAVPVLVEMLGDDRVESYARAALRRIKDSSVIWQLIEAVGKDEHPLSTTAEVLLKELTGQSLGNDYEAWKEWAEGNLATP